jgi:hypothetical protein
MQYVNAAYLLVMCTLLPLYMKKGYYKLGEAKGVAFLTIGVIFATLLCLIWCEKRVLQYAKRETPKADSLLEGRELPLGCLIAFLGSNVISLIFSMDKEVAVFGLDGWRTGFLTWFFMILLSLFIGFYGIGSEKTRPVITVLSMIVPFLMFLMGIVNRFGIYPVEIYGQNNSYLATLGNINWYTGFLSVFVPVGAGFCYVSKRFSLRFFLWAIFEVLGIMALFLQGSESALLIIAGTFFVLLFMGLKERESFKDASSCLFLLGLGMELAGLLYIRLYDFYTYEDSMLILSCSRHIGLVIMAVAFVFYRVSRLFEEIKVGFYGKKYRIVLVAGAAILCVITGIYLIRNFGDDFGNGRGVIWRLSFLAFSRETFWQKLVGVGPDCFHAFAQSQDEVAAGIHEVFGNSRLTNAHSELLTVLIQNGILGAVTYLGLIGTMIFSLIKRQEQGGKDLGAVFVLPITAYFLNSLVSFPQATSTPYFFICIGIGLYILNKKPSC